MAETHKSDMPLAAIDPSFGFDSSRNPDRDNCPLTSVASFKNDESGRLLALARADILDTAAEALFEAITDLVCQILQVPVCAISLVDRDRQWFKSQRGLEVCETARDISFCQHAIAASHPFVVPDAANHPLFMHNPLVTDGPKIRSYAGIPLRTPEGYNLGTLCAIDVIPRSFTPSEIAMLGSFAKVVMREIELRQIASTDVLTGVMSRRAWVDCAEREISRTLRNGNLLSFFIADIDHFKAVNDCFGHPVGDKVIAGFAQAISEVLRKSDWFGRFGGEEFVAALPETGIVDAMQLAERIRAKIAALRFSCIDDGSCTISIGVAGLVQGESRLGSVLERVDGALYEAKRAGRNRVRASTANSPVTLRTAA